MMNIVLRKARALSESHNISTSLCEYLNSQIIFLNRIVSFADYDKVIYLDSDVDKTTTF